MGRLINAESDLIERDKAIDAIREHIEVVDGDDDALDYIATNMLKDVPSARPKGEWVEREVLEDTVINEWQSARCSECGKYHTTPYMYYFGNFNFCPHCGADMREREGE